MPAGSRSRSSEWQLVDREQGWLEEDGPPLGEFSPKFQREPVVARVRGLAHRLGEAGDGDDAGASATASSTASISARTLTGTLSRKSNAGNDRVGSSLWCLWKKWISQGLRMIACRSFELSDRKYELIDRDLIPAHRRWLEVRCPRLESTRGDIRDGDRPGEHRHVPGSLATLAQVGPSWWSLPSPLEAVSGSD